MKLLPGHFAVSRGFHTASGALDQDRRRSRRRRLIIGGACVLAVPVLVTAWFIIGVDLMAFV